MEMIEWGTQTPLRFTWSESRAVSSAFAGGRPGAVMGSPLAEVLVLGQGRSLAGARTYRTAVADRLRHVSHREFQLGGVACLEVVQSDPELSLRLTTRIEDTGTGAYRASTQLENQGGGALMLQAVSSAVLSSLLSYIGPGGANLFTARNEWCSESRWASIPLYGPGGLADVNPEAHGQSGRNSWALAGNSTWSAAEHLPMGLLQGRDTGRAIAWEVENNGPWRWELNTRADSDVDLVLTGPDDLYHSWLEELPPGGSFTTVPVSFAAAERFDAAIGALTWHRRRSGHQRQADAGRPLVFNDYMNALMGDPTSTKLRPLIAAAAEAGAEVFCIDAGWYDDDGDWWPSVGAWEPSKKRFGAQGLKGVLDLIRRSGMKPGLWIEPEVIGIRSPVADELPEDAFMRRGGRRIVEQERYFLDLRSNAARVYLDAVFDRLIGDYGVRYFKWDYNVTPGVGPDTDAASPGAGLLGHCRALRDWTSSLRSRHPEVILEACSSGAQRTDQAWLSLFDLQSTSDQQDYRLYPAIAAAAPMIMRPEQAGNWAYPHSLMTLEQVAFNLVTGLSGRLYLSGYLNGLDRQQFALVREAAGLYPRVIAHQAASLPSWPLGLPSWDAPVMALATSTEDETLLFVWNRAGDGEVSLDLSASPGRSCRQLFPASLPAWPALWDGSSLRLDLAGTGESARILRLA
ncbi:MAG: alpha-galactosidase [Bifidobacteriaceae bacterium]|jgi:alpha-galactosidase|nr:alpha-galactosidase [Bifidobacteriaceae bacterium]